MAAAAAATVRSGHERWRRAARILGFVLTGTSVLITIATLAAWRYAGSPSGRARLGAMVQDRLAPTLPGLQLGEVGHDSGELVAGNVNVWDSAGRRAVHVERVRIRPRWTALLTKHVAIEELRLEGIQVLGRPTGADGRGPLNLASLAPPRAPTTQPARDDPPAPHLPVSVQVERLVVSDATIDLWTGGEAPRVVVRDLDLTGRFESAERRTEFVVDRLGAQLTVDQRELTVAARASGRVDGTAVDVLLDTLQLTGATPAGTVALRAGAGGSRASLKVWATGTGPGESRLDATGTVALGPTSALERYHLQLSADAPVLTTLLAGAPAGGASLRLQAQGVGVPLAPDSRAAVTAYFPSITVAGRALDQAFVQASSAGTTWHLARAEAHAPGVTAEVSGRGDGPELHAKVNVAIHDMGSARRTVGLRRGAAPAVPRQGAGRLAATVDGRLDQQLTFSAEARARRLASTAWGRLARLDLDVRGTARRDARWTVAARATGRVDGLAGPQVKMGSARIRANASVAGRGAEALQLANLTLHGTGLRVGQTAFDRLDLAARAARGALSLSVAAAGPSGTATVAARGRRRAERVEVTVDRLDLAVSSPGPRQRLTLDRPASIVVRPERDVEVTDLAVRGAGELLSGRAVISGMARLTRPPSGTPWARLDVTLDRLTTAGLPPLTGALHASADGQRALGKLDLRMDASTLSARLDLPAVIRSSLGELRLSREGNIDVSVQGKDIQLATLPPLQRFLSRWGLVGGTITASATVTGPLARPDAKVALDVRSLELRDVTGKGRDSAIHTIPGIGASLRLDTGADEVRSSGTLFMYGAGVATFSAKLAVGPGALLAGTDVRTVPLSARVDVPRFQINALTSLSDELRDTRGWLAGGASISGTLAAPRGSAEFSVSDLHVDQLPVGRVVAKATTDGRILRAQASVGGGNAGGTSPGTLDARAEVSLGAPRTLTARIQAKGLNPGMARPFLTGIRELDGVVDADVRARGTLPNVALDGRVYAYRGSLGVVGQPTFRGIGATVALRSGRIDLETLQMYSGGGSLEARGWVTLDGLRPRNGVLNGSARRFVIAAAGVSGARLDGEWAVEVARRQSVLTGKIEVPQAALWLPKLALGGRKPQRITPHDDVRFVDGASRAAEARERAQERADARGTGGEPPLEVKVQAKARTIYVRGKDLDLELESGVTVKTAPTGKGPLQLFGAVRFRRGHINIQGQRFEVGTGSITFDGPPSAPLVDIKLSRTYPDARVLIELRGRPDKPQLRLSSEPAIYDQGQIVSLILTGQAQGRAGSPGAGTGGSGSFDPTATIATAVLSKLADKVAPEIGLDVIRVERAKPAEQSATTAAGDFAGRVEVGKYVTERVYVSYAHRFGATERQNANEAHAEYRISPHWIAETVFGDAGVGGVDAFWIHRY